MGSNVISSDYNQELNEVVWRAYGEPQHKLAKVLSLMVLVIILEKRDKIFIKQKHKNKSFC